MFTGVPLGFPCARSGLLLPFSSLCFFCLLILGLKSLVYARCAHPSIPRPSIPLPYMVVFVCILRAQHAHPCPQRPHVPLQAPFPCPTMSYCPTAPIRIHKCPPWACMDIPGPWLHWMPCFVHFAMFDYVVHGALACVFGVPACMFRSVSPPHMPQSQPWTHTLMLLSLWWLFIVMLVSACLYFT